MITKVHYDCLKTNWITKITYCIHITSFILIHHTIIVEKNNNSGTCVITTLYNRVYVKSMYVSLNKYFEKSTQA